MPRNNEGEISMSTMNKQEQDVLNLASQVPSSVKTEEFNPMERFPRVAVGDTFKEGQTIAGWYEETLVIASEKFRYGEGKNEEGLNTKSLHVLRVGSPTGPRLGIWSVQDLKNTFQDLAQGTFIAITYKGKGQGANGNQKHFFEYKRQSN